MQLIAPSTANGTTPGTKNRIQQTDCRARAIPPAELSASEDNVNTSIKQDGVIVSRALPIHIPPTIIVQGKRVKHGQSRCSG